MTVLMECPGLKSSHLCQSTIHLTHPSDQLPMRISSLLVLTLMVMNWLKGERVFCNIAPKLSIFFNFLNQLLIKSIYNTHC